jgi:hypothetical protein
VLIGDACAHIPAHANGGKAAYRQIGKAFKDGDGDGDRISIKIDTLPLPGSGWEGWINVFPPKQDLDPAPDSSEPIAGTRRIIKF